MDQNKNNYHGLFLVKKDPGMTSHDVVYRLRKILSTPSIGHSGTLDPIAEGLLILLVGEATKLSQYILEGNKSYLLEMQLGIRTDTFDITGEKLEEKPVDVSTDLIRTLANQFSGEKEWNVPIHSAVKVKGKKLYEYAREQQEIIPPKKIMKFWDVEFIQREGNFVRFHLHCSKGSYIRTWIQEFGLSLGCGATMTKLIRTSSVPFHVDQASSLEEIDQAIKGKKSLSCFIPLEQALPQSKKIRVKGQDQRLLKNGQISHDLKLQLIQVCNPEIDRLIVATSVELEPLALIGFEPEVGFLIRRVFHFH